MAQIAGISISAQAQRDQIKGQEILFEIISQTCSLPDGVNQSGRRHSIAKKVFEQQPFFGANHFNSFLPSLLHEGVVKCAKAFLSVVVYTGGNQKEIPESDGEMAGGSASFSLPFALEYEGRPIIGRMPLRAFRHL